MDIMPTLLFFLIITIVVSLCGRKLKNVKPHVPGMIKEIYISNCGTFEEPEAQFDITFNDGEKRTYRVKDPKNIKMIKVGESDYIDVSDELQREICNRACKDYIM